MIYIFEVLCLKKQIIIFGGTQDISKYRDRPIFINIYFRLVSRQAFFN
jgi:hypothetical protein